MSSQLYKAAQRLHDYLDGKNLDIGRDLCDICRAVTYNPREGVEHKEDCFLLELRLALAHYKAVGEEIE